jgi:nitroreductase
VSDLKHNQEFNPRIPDAEIHPIFLERWSPRSFTDQPVSEEVLLSILEAARWAPSSSNLQPWRYIIARTSKDRESFYSFIMPGNLEWCKKAPILILLLSHTLQANGDLNRAHGFDTGTAWGFMAIEAVNQGLITHAMGGFHADQARTILHIPDEYALHAVIALGYQGEKSALPEHLQIREIPNARRPITESLYEGLFGQHSLAKE